MKLGIEIEWGDVDRSAELLPGWTWSRNEVWIANTDGTPNDPKGKLPLRGGELNSPPFDTAADMELEIDMLAAMLQPAVTHRAATHIHVSDPRLDDLDTVKRVAQVSRDCLRDNYLGVRVDDLAPIAADGTEASLKWQKYVRKHNQSFTTDARHTARMAAGTLEEMLAAEVPISKTGKPQWHLSFREAVNLRSLRKTGTIEFRFFAGTTDPGAMAAAAEFSRLWISEAMDGTDPRPAVEHLLGELPRQVPYDDHLEQLWRRYNFRDHTRREVEAAMVADGRLEP